MTPVRFDSILGGTLFTFVRDNGTVWGKNSTSAGMIGFPTVWRAVAPDTLVYPLPKSEYSQWLD